jgi:two-component system chemotaxis response regulator CheY
MLRAGTDFALVVCDVNMPRMSGLELLAAMRDDATIAGTRVVMLTVEGKPLRHAKQLGATAWMLKPFKPEHLLLAVRKLVSGAAA